MADVKSLSGIAHEAWKLDWSTKSALVSGTLLNIMGTALLAVALNAMGFGLGATFYLVMLCALEVVVVAVWLRMRYLRVLDPRVVSVGLAIHSDPESQLFYTEIKASFRRYIEEHGLGDTLLLRELPGDLHFTTGKAAEKYIEDRGLRVVLWGDTTRSTVNGERVSVFNVRYSCQYTAKNKDAGRGFVGFLNIGARRGQWMIPDTNSLDGLRVVGGNVVEISMFVLAACLISTRRPEHKERGIEILEDLSRTLAGRVNDSNFPNLPAFKDQITEVIVRECLAFGGDLLLKRKYGEAEAWVERALRHNPSDYYSHVGMARVAWERGNQAQARQHTVAAWRLKPREMLPYLNFAFFHLYNGKYGKALGYYKKLNDKVCEANMLDVVDFLERQYEASDKTAILFGAGWLSYHYADKVRGVELLERFVAEAGRDASFSKLVAAAVTILQKAERAVT